MTLIHLLFAVIAFFVLFGAAKMLDTYIAGSCWTSTLLVALLVSSAVILRRYAGKALFPKCRNGICGPRDYEGVPAQPGDAGPTFKCKCGQRYLLKRNQFLVLGVNGQTMPYKIKRRFCSGWVDDA